MIILNIVDILIIIFILLCIVTGCNRGIIKEGMNVLGTILMVVISFSLMGTLANAFYKFLPFFPLGLGKINLTALNILLYQILAFAIIFSILNLIFRIILTITNIVDKLLNALIIMKPVSSFLGGIVGFISGVVVSFVILLILSVPLSGFKTFHESKITNFILDKTPLFAPLTQNITNATNDIYKLVSNINDEEEKIKNANKYNLEAMDIMLKYKLITPENLEILQKQNKLNSITGIENIINKYK